MMFSKESYTCHDLALLGKELQDLKMSLLFDKVEDAHFTSIAEIEYLKALHFLEQASLCMKQAGYFQEKGI